MKRTVYRILLSFLILAVTLNSIIFVHGEITALEPEFGETPEIDGVIDTGLDEWDGALKDKITLYKNLSNPTSGLVMDFWIMQDDDYLFIAIQFEFDEHSSSEFCEEFVGVSISEDDPDDPPEFKDAKITQFSNISTGEFTYADYWINDSIYYIDDQSDGEGAAALEGDKVVYEFSIPTDVFDESYQDVYLRPSVEGIYIYAFNIIYGKTPSYPDGILLSNYKFVEIQFSEKKNPFTGWELVLLTLNIVIFGSIGGFYFFYIYRITKLKDKIRRLRS